MKFLVCFDETDEAKKALKVAQEHAKIWNAKLEVVNTITRVEPLKHSTVKKMEEKMESDVKEILGSDDPPYEVQLLLTDLTSGEQLVKFAEDQKMDQIFLNDEIKTAFETAGIKGYKLFNADGWDGLDI